MSYSRFYVTLSESLTSKGYRIQKTELPYGKVVSELTPRDAFNLVGSVLRAIFKEVLLVGRFRFPAGLGVLSVKKLAGKVSVHPRTGVLYEIGEREKVKYSQGVTVKALLSGG